MSDFYRTRQRCLRVVAEAGIEVAPEAARAAAAALASAECTCELVNTTWLQEALQTGVSHQGKAVQS